MGPLDGVTILVPESRERDLFVRLLEAEGATTLCCPLVRILDLEDTQDAQAWIDRCIAGALDDLILLTGEGLRRLLTIAGAAHAEAFIAAVERLRIITRGPKPARALREIGLTSTLAASVPTSDGVLAALANENVEGRRIGVQLYPGDGGMPLVAALRARGADVFPVTPYRYASEAETRDVVETIHALEAGQIGMIAFTASPQIERLFDVARHAGLDAALARGIARTAIAAIGPVVEETLRAHGVTRIVRPDASFHLKPLVRAIVAWRTKQTD